MRYFLSSSLALLAACVIVAGCGSSSSKPPQSNNGMLSGTYVFDQQLYTYYSNIGSSARRSPLQASSTRRLAPKARHQTTSLHRPIPHLVGHVASTVLTQGSDPSYTGVVWGAMAGSLTFDGKGNVTGGEIDYNEPEAGYFHDTVKGAYFIGADGSGHIQLTSQSGGSVFYFDILLQGDGTVASSGQMIESYADDAGNVEIGTGTLLQQAGSISQSSINGNYVFGTQGEGCYGCTTGSGGDLYAAGLLSADGNGSFGGGSQADVANQYATDNQVPLSGTYGTPDSMGRVTASLSSNNVLPQNYVLYVANPTTFFVLAVDTSDSLAPAYLFGQAHLQSGTFSNASLSGNYVLAENMEDLQNANTPDTYTDAYLALLSAGGGVFSGSGDANVAGAVSANVPFNYGGYSVAPNGRVTFAGTTPTGAPAPVIWLQNSSFGYGIDQLRGNTTAQNPGLIRLYGQPVGTGYSPASLNGPYAMGTLPAATSYSILYGAALNADGASKLTGSGVASFFTSDGGSGAIGSADGTYTVSPSGRGTVTGTGNSLFGNAILYVVGGGQSLGMDVTDGEVAPSLQIIEQ